MSPCRISEGVFKLDGHGVSTSNNPPFRWRFVIIEGALQWQCWSFIKQLDVGCLSIRIKSPFEIGAYSTAYV